MAAVNSLKVFAIANRTDSSGTDVDDVDQEELRMLTGVLLAPGYTRNLTDQSANANAFRVRQDTGSNMQVKVGSGTTKIDGYVVRGTVAGQGSYLVRLDATTVTVTVPATDATNPRKYGVYLWVNDASYSGTAGRRYAGISCLAGTPAGSPTTPGPDATWSAYTLLWEFQLAANATAVTNTILDNATTNDQRVRTVPVVAPGGLVAPIASVSADQTLTTSVADVTSLSLSSFRVSPGRQYKATVVLYGNSSGATNVTVNVVTGTSGAGTALNPSLKGGSMVDSTGDACSVVYVGYFTRSAPETLSLHVRALTDTSTFTIDGTGGTSAGSWFSVEDIGPST